MTASKKKVVLIIITLFICMVTFVMSPLIIISTNLMTDLYKESITSITNVNLFRLTWVTRGVIIRSSISLETRNNYSQVSDWYKKRGWYCDGACEGNNSEINIGPIKLCDDWRLMKRIEKENQNGNMRIILYEEYILEIN
jgi:hypothetical protein